MPFPSQTVTYDSLYTAAVESFVSEMRADVIYEDNLILNSLYRADMARRGGTEKPMIPVTGNIRPVDRRFPGRNIVIPVLTEQGTNAQSFRHLQPLTTNLDEVGTYQRAEYALYTGFSGLSKHEQLLNSGDVAVLSLLEDRAYQKMQDIRALVEGHFWGTGTDTGDGQPNVMGIQHLFGTAGSETVWGISRTTYTWQDINVVNAAGLFSSVGRDSLVDGLVAASGESGVDAPSVFITTPVLWNAWNLEVEDKHQPTMVNAETVANGAPFRGTPWVYSNSCPSGIVYGPNMRYLHLFMPPGWDFQTENYDSPPTTAWAVLERCFLALQWGISRHDRQLVVHGFTDT